VVGKAAATAATNLRRPVGPDREADGVLDAMRVAAATFRREARAVLAPHDVPWPAEFGEAVGRFWQAELGWTGSASTG
jgi:hypothetical protein